MRRRSAIKLICSLVVGGGLAVAGYAAAERSDLGQGSARFVSSFVLSASPDWFGGFSAIALGADGRDMTIMTDRSHMVSGRIERANGKITTVSFNTHTHLRNSRGQPMVKGRDSLDSEGLAIGTNGDMFVSFEGKARVSRYTDAHSPAQDLPQPDAFKTYRENKSLEALAIDPQGHLYTVPENTTAPDYPIWRWNGTVWEQPFTVSKEQGFYPVGLDFGPDGRLYLLERKFVLIGFRSRLRRWTLSDTGLTHEERLLTTSIGTHDNLEGLSIWRDEQDRLRATMVSDNNFLPFQRSELVEYLLPD